MPTRREIRAKANNQEGFAAVTTQRQAKRFFGRRALLRLPGTRNRITVTLVGYDEDENYAAGGWPWDTREMGNDGNWWGHTNAEEMVYFLELII